VNYIGIDLGTTFSVVAYLDDVGSPRIIKNEDGENITPSCVASIGGKLEVGQRAKRHAHNAPEEGAKTFKRAMGTDKQYLVAGGTLSPADLSAEVLKRMKSVAEAELGEVGKAVVTIPANFAHEAREATMHAAEIAGLEVEFIINEPTAAALYYAYAEQEDLHGTYAVYDLGGGTFDVSIIKVNGGDVDVIATNGVSQLGGDDFDKKLRDLVKEKFEQETGKEFDPEDFTEFDAEQEKIALSQRKRTTVQIGRTLIDIRREDFEEQISSLIAQAEMLCESTLDEADVEPEEINAVFLAGGSTRLPMVRESIERVFKQEPLATADVDEVVAKGAALYAAYKSDRSGLSQLQSKSLDKIRVSESTSMCFGTISLSYNENREQYEQHNSVLINKGEKIPISVTETFYLTHDDQAAVHCRVTESKTRETNPKFVKVVADEELKLPEGVKEQDEVEITYSFTENQTMEASFVHKPTGTEAKLNLSFADSSQKKPSGADKFTV
jgi:molecular chaperone DnaK